MCDTFFSLITVSLVHIPTRLLLHFSVIYPQAATRLLSKFYKTHIPIKNNLIVINNYVNYLYIFYHNILKQGRKAHSASVLNSRVLNEINTNYKAINYNLNYNLVEFRNLVTLMFCIV